MVLISKAPQYPRTTGSCKRHVEREARVGDHRLNAPGGQAHVARAEVDSRYTLLVPNRDERKQLRRRNRKARLARARDRARPVQADPRAAPSVENAAGPPATPTPPATTYDAAGLTISEKYLGRLCRRTFLNLWSYQNVFKQPGKELCDLLVIFGDDVLIFSDKHCALDVAMGPDVAWPRWYRNAVLASARQLAGAERWIKEQPERLFLDRKCQMRLPIAVPKNARIHRVITCRGAGDASRSVWGGRGSLFVTNKPLNECEGRPLTLGFFDERRRPVHVFDEVALDAVLGTLDTVADFCSYLRKKEAFFERTQEVIATGEEDLLGYYLGHWAEGAHDFKVDAGVTTVFFDESQWSGWCKSEQFKAKKRADAISYAWDKLIEKFSFHIAAGTQEFASPGGVPAQEPIVRWMAREGRLRRRMLAQCLLDAMKTTPKGQARRRYMKPSFPGDPFWVFFVLPRTDDYTEAKYRETRRVTLAALCYIVKYLNPEATDICGIAVGTNPNEMSEDAIYLDARNWTASLEQEARELYERTGFFSQATMTKDTEWEYPLRIK